MSEPAAASPQASLAELIYVELVGRAFLTVNNSASFKPDPAQLAKLAIELATEFEKAAKIHKTASGPKNVGYDVSKMDLGSIGT